MLRCGQFFTPTPQPSATPTPAPSTPMPSAQPTPAPSTPEPSSLPTGQPTPEPTAEQNICDVYDDGAGCTKCLKVKDMNHCYDADNSKAKCDSWGKDYLWCGN